MVASCVSFLLTWKLILSSKKSTGPYKIFPILNHSAAILRQKVARLLVLAYFLDASSHFYMRVCPSVGPSMGPSVSIKEKPAGDASYCLPGLFHKFFIPLPLPPSLFTASRSFFSRFFPLALFSPLALFRTCPFPPYCC